VRDNMDILHACQHGTIKMSLPWVSLTKSERLMWISICSSMSVVSLSNHSSFITQKFSNFQWFSTRAQNSGIESHSTHSKCVNWVQKADWTQIMFIDIRKGLKPLDTELLQVVIAFTNLKVSLTLDVEY